MKKYIRSIFLILLLSILFSCAEKTSAETPGNPSKNAKEILSVIVDQRYKDSTAKNAVGIMICDTDLNFENAKKYIYRHFENFKPEKYTGFALYPSAFSNIPDEYGIIEVKDKTEIGKAALMLKNRIKRLYEQFSSDKEAAKMIENAKIRSSGNYIYYAVTKENEHILNQIENMLVNS